MDPIKCPRLIMWLWLHSIPLIASNTKHNPTSLKPYVTLAALPKPNPASLSVAHHNVHLQTSGSACPRSPFGPATHWHTPVHGAHAHAQLDLMAH